MNRSNSICCSVCGAKSECPPSDGTMRYRPPSQTKIDCPSPVPAASSAIVPPGSGLPMIQHAKFFRPEMLDAVPGRAEIVHQHNLLDIQFPLENPASTVHGRFVARTWLSITGPATPNPAAST